MKKLIAVFCLSFVALSANADERYAHEYSSDNDEQRDRQRDDGYESENHEKRRFFQSPRYGQNYQQPPIQIYLAPNQNFRPRDEHHRRHSNDKEYREDRRWRERREELQQQPQTPYFENQFNRDDTHW